MARSRRKSKTPSDRGAFTLVELLVVIVMLGLLMALLVGGIQSAHEHAINTQCKWNLHQLWQVLQANETPGFPAPKNWTFTVSQIEAAPCLVCPKHNVDTSKGSEKPGESGNVVLIAPPPSVVFNQVESNTLIRYFIEREDFTLPESVTVDISQPGRYDNNYSSTSTTISAGTVVNCTFLFFDPVGSQSATSSGAITMSGEIIGILCTDSKLNATDAVLGRAGTTYATGQGSRGFENNAEQVSLETDLQTFTIHNFHSTFPGENVRILTVGGAEGSSYGMNNQIRPTGSSPAQILLLEYRRSVADVDGLNADGMSQDDDFYKEVAPRHFGLVNVLTVEGSVESFSPEEIDPRDHPTLWKP